MDTKSKSEKRPPTVLFVDDDQILLQMFKLTFANHLEHRFIWFRDSREALESFAQSFHKIDLVITDFKMPALSGNDLASALRALKPTIPIIGVSSDPGQFNPDLFDLTMRKTNEKQVFIDAIEKVLADRP